MKSEDDDDETPSPTTCDFVMYAVIAVFFAVYINMFMDRFGNFVDEQINSCENGAEFVDGSCDCSNIPFEGRNCQNSSCTNGGFNVYDVKSVKVISRTNTLWSCFCKNRYSGYNCEICNAVGEDCTDKCVVGYYGTQCQNTCYANLNDSTKFQTSTSEGVNCASAVENGGSCTFCSGHGVCSDAGGCTCNPGFSGTACEVECPKTDDGYCSNNGVCSEGVCTCEDGFSGLTCEHQCRDKCSGAGICTVAEEEAICVCFDRYRGDHCQHLCPGVSVCSGRGVCNVNGTCTCEQSWEGEACNCQSETTCNGYGTCKVDGTCQCTNNRAGNCQVCIPNYYGEDCDVQCRAETDCNGHGACSISGVCVCDSGWAGTGCDQCAVDVYPLAQYSDPCEFIITNATCNHRGYANVHFGNDNFAMFESAGIEVGKYMCKCIGNFSEESFCSECTPNHYTNDDGECIKYCDDNMCMNGVCVEDGTCSCDPDFFGEFCDSGCSNVNGVICSGHGTCKKDEWIATQNTKCVCDSGYEGSECQLSAPISGGAICNGRGVAMITPVVHTGFSFDCNVDADCGDEEGDFTGSTMLRAMQIALRQALFGAVSTSRPYGPMCKRQLAPLSMQDIGGSVGTIDIPEWTMTAMINGPFRMEVPEGFVYPLYTYQKYPTGIKINGIQFYGPNTAARDYSCNQLETREEAQEAGCVWLDSGLCDYLMQEVDASEWCYQREQYEVNNCDVEFNCPDVPFICDRTCVYTNAQDAIDAWNAKHMDTPFDGEDLIESTFEIDASMYLEGASVDECEVVLTWDVPVRVYPSPRFWCQVGERIDKTDDPNHINYDECNEIGVEIAGFGGFVVKGTQYDTFREAMDQVNDMDTIQYGNQYQYAETMTIDEMCVYYDPSCAETWHSDTFATVEFVEPYQMFQYTFELEDFNAGTYIALSNASGVMVALTHDQRLTLNNEGTVSGPLLERNVVYTVRFQVVDGVLTCEDIRNTACPGSIPVVGAIRGVSGVEVGARLSALHAFNDTGCKEASWRLRMPPGWTTTKTIWALCNERHNMKIRSKALCEYRDSYKHIVHSTLTRLETLECVRLVTNMCSEMGQQSEIQQDCLEWSARENPNTCEQEFNINTPTIDKCSSSEWASWCNTLKQPESASNTGKCAVIQCDCDHDTYLGVSGSACQLSCPVNSDTGTACGFQNPPEYSFGTCRDVDAKEGQHTTESTCDCQRSTNINCDERCDDETASKCNPGEYRRETIRSFDAWGYDDFIPDNSLNMMPYEECRKYLDHHRATEVIYAGDSGICRWNETHMMWGGTSGNLVSTLVTSKEECKQLNSDLDMVIDYSITGDTPLDGDGMVFERRESYSVVQKLSTLQEKKIYDVNYATDVSEVDIAAGSIVVIDGDFYEMYSRDQVISFSQPPSGQLTYGGTIVELGTPSVSTIWMTVSDVVVPVGSYFMQAAVYETSNGYIYTKGPPTSSLDKGVLSSDSLTVLLNRDEGQCSGLGDWFAIETIEECQASVLVVSLMELDEPLVTTDVTITTGRQHGCYIVSGTPYFNTDGDSITTTFMDTQPICTTQPNSIRVELDMVTTVAGYIYTVDAVSDGLIDGSIAVEVDDNSIYSPLLMPVASSVNFWNGNISNVNVLSVDDVTFLDQLLVIGDQLQQYVNVGKLQDSGECTSPVDAVECPVLMYESAVDIVFKGIVTNASLPSGCVVTKTTTTYLSTSLQNGTCEAVLSQQECEQLPNYDGEGAWVGNPRGCVKLGGKMYYNTISGMSAISNNSQSDNGGCMYQESRIQTADLCETEVALLGIQWGGIHDWTEHPVGCTLMSTNGGIDTKGYYNVGGSATWCTGSSTDSVPVVYQGCVCRSNVPCDVDQYDGCMCKQELYEGYYNTNSNENCGNENMCMCQASELVTHDVVGPSAVRGLLTEDTATLYTHQGQYTIMATAPYEQQYCTTTCVTCNAQIGNILFQGTTQALVHDRVGDTYSVLTIGMVEDSVYTSMECTNMVQLTLATPVSTQETVELQQGTSHYKVLNYHNNIVVVITNASISEKQCVLYHRVGTLDVSNVSYGKMTTGSGDFNLGTIKQGNANVFRTGDVVGLDPLLIVSTEAWSEGISVQGSITTRSVLKVETVTNATILPTTLHFDTAYVQHVDVTVRPVSGTVSQLQIRGELDSGRYNLSIPVPALPTPTNKKSFSYNKTIATNIGDVAQQGNNVGIVSRTRIGSVQSTTTTIESTNDFVAGSVVFGAPQTFNVTFTESNGILGSGSMCTQSNGVYMWDNGGVTVAKVQEHHGDCLAEPYQAYVCPPERVVLTLQQCQQATQRMGIVFAAQGIFATDGVLTLNTADEPTGCFVRGSGAYFNLYAGVPCVGECVCQASFTEFHPAELVTGNGTGCYYNNTHVVAGENIGNPANALVQIKSDCESFLNYHRSESLYDLGGSICSYNLSHVVWGPNVCINGTVAGVPSGELPLKISECAGGVCTCNPPNQASFNRYSTSFTGARTRIVEKRFFGRHKRSNFMQGPQPYLINHVKYNNNPITIDNWETMYDLWLNSKTNFKCSQPEFAKSGEGCGDNIMCVEQSEVCKTVRGVQQCVRGTEGDEYIGIYTYKQCLTDSLQLSYLQDSSAYRGKHCMDECPEITEFGTPCAGHGRCSQSGQCSCDVASTMVKYTQNTRSVIKNEEGKPLISFMGHESMTMEERTGWRGTGCEKRCRGYDADASDMTGICTENGRCNADVTCTCAIGFTGDNCQLNCPRRAGSNEKVICSGHGACQPTIITAKESQKINESIVQWREACTLANPVLDTMVVPQTEPTLKYGRCDDTIMSQTRCTMKASELLTEGFNIDRNENGFIVDTGSDVPHGCSLKRNEGGYTLHFNDDHSNQVCSETQQCICLTPTSMEVSQLQFYEDVSSSSHVYLDANGKILTATAITTKFVKDNGFEYPLRIVAYNEELTLNYVDGHTRGHIRGGPNCESTMLSNADFVRPQLEIRWYRDSEVKWNKRKSATVDNASPLFPYTPCGDLDNADCVQKCQDECWEKNRCAGFVLKNNKCKFVEKWSAVVVEDYSDFFEIQSCQSVEELVQQCDVLDSETLLCAECACTSSNGFWGGTDCRTCQQGFGGQSCKQKCPGYDGVSPETICGGLGTCISGSTDALGEDFLEPSCVCGDNPFDMVGLQQCDLHVRGHNEPTSTYAIQTSSPCMSVPTIDKCAELTDNSVAQLEQTTTGPQGCYYVPGSDQVFYNPTPSTTLCQLTLDTCDLSDTVKDQDTCMRAAFEHDGTFMVTDSVTLPAYCSYDVDHFTYNTNVGSTVQGLAVCGGYRCVCDTNYESNGREGGTCSCKRGYSDTLCNKPTPTCLFGGTPYKLACSCDDDRLDGTQNCCPNGMESTGSLLSGLPSYLTDSMQFTKWENTPSRTKQYVEECVPTGPEPTDFTVETYSKFLNPVASDMGCITEGYNRERCIMNCNNDPTCNAVAVYHENGPDAGKCCYVNSWSTPPPKTWKYMFEGECSDSIENWTYKWRGECGGPELMKYALNSGTSTERRQKCAAACFSSEDGKGVTWEVGGITYTALGFIIYDQDDDYYNGRCFCEPQPSATCTSAAGGSPLNSLSNYERYDFKNYESAEKIIYSGVDNPGTTAETRIKACADACDGYTWSTDDIVYEAQGFIVFKEGYNGENWRSGRCYCESSDSATCVRGTVVNNGWRRYDFNNEISAMIPVIPVAIAMDPLLTKIGSKLISIRHYLGDYIWIVALHEHPWFHQFKIKITGVNSYEVISENSVFLEAGWDYIFRGECGGAEYQKYTNSNNPGQTDIEQRQACADACFGFEWSSNDIEYTTNGFIVYNDGVTKGNCYCESADSSCTKVAQGSNWYRYDYNGIFTGTNLYSERCLTDMTYSIKCFYPNGDTDSTLWDNEQARVKITEFATIGEFGETDIYFAKTKRATSQLWDLTVDRLYESCWGNGVLTNGGTCECNEVSLKTYLSTSGCDNVWIDVPEPSILEKCQNYSVTELNKTMTGLTFINNAVVNQPESCYLNGTTVIFGPNSKYQIRTSGQCTQPYRQIISISECQSANLALGYDNIVTSTNEAMYPPGCIRSDGISYFHTVDKSDTIYSCSTLYPCICMDERMKDVAPLPHICTSQYMFQNKFCNCREVDIMTHHKDYYKYIEVDGTFCDDTNRRIRTLSHCQSAVVALEAENIEVDWSWISGQRLALQTMCPLSSVITQLFDIDSCMLMCDVKPDCNAISFKGAPYYLENNAVNCVNTIDTAEKCQQAGDAIGYTRHVNIGSWGHVPSGCMLFKPELRPYFNERDTNEKCNSPNWIGSDSPCICRSTATCCLSRTGKFNDPDTVDDTDWWTAKKIRTKDVVVIDQSHRPGGCYVDRNSSIAYYNINEGRPSASRTREQTICYRPIDTFVCQIGRCGHYQCRCPSGHADQNGECIRCEIGKYSGDAACILCNAGLYTDTTGQMQCKTCPDGYHNDIGEGDCKACPGGKYGVNTVSTDNPCVICNAGQTSDIGSGSCRECDIGQYGNTAGQCLSCDAGKYQDDTAATQCKSCMMGMFQSANAASSCLLCPSGYFVDTIDSLNCKACSTGLISGAGSNNVRDCRCEIIDPLTLQTNDVFTDPIMVPVVSNLCYKASVQYIADNFESQMYITNMQNLITIGNQPISMNNKFYPRGCWIDIRSSHVVFGHLVYNVYYNIHNTLSNTQPLLSCADQTSVRCIVPGRTDFSSNDQAGCASDLNDMMVCRCNDVGWQFMFDGECTGAEKQIYELKSNNPGTTLNERIQACANSCFGYSWTSSGTTHTAAGFLVWTLSDEYEGRCYCEAPSSTNCARAGESGNYDRYDFDTTNYDSTCQDASTSECCRTDTLSTLECASMGRTHLRMVGNTKVCAGTSTQSDWCQNNQYLGLA